MCRRLGLLIASLASAVACAVLVPRETMLAVLASVAGTLFEATPLVLIASAAPPRARAAIGSLGCGCGSGGLPGALAPAAVLFCWIAFGPAVAVARAAAAGSLAVVAGVLRRSARDEHPCADRGAPHNAAPRDDADPFSDLLRIGASAAVASVLATVAVPGLHGTITPIAVGLALGMAAPCAIAGIALGAGFAPHAPLLTVAILTVSGVVPRVSSRLGPLKRNGATRTCDARFAALLTAGTCALLLVRGPAGLVNPRLLPLVAAGAVAALVLAAGRPRAPRSAWLVPAFMAAGIVAGSHAPVYVASETTAAAGFAGEAATFTGVAEAPGRGETGTRLVRFAISCCRIDATAIRIVVDRRLPVRDGTWISAKGIFAASTGDGVILSAPTWRAVPTPADPFVYR